MQQPNIEVLISEIFEFVECAVHSVLYARKFYPCNLFEQRRYQDVMVWQSRHPDINTYVRRVMDNMRVLIEKGAVDRIVVVTCNATGKAIDHLTIKFKFLNEILTASQYDFNETARAVLSEELRSTILRISLVGAQMPKLPEESSWHVMVITNVEECSTEGDAIIQNALSNGEWLVDNNMSTEQQALSNRLSGRSSSSRKGDTNTSSSNRDPVLIPVKSFQTDAANVAVYAHVF